MRSGEVDIARIENCHRIAIETCYTQDALLVTPERSLDALLYRRRGAAAAELTVCTAAEAQPRRLAIEECFSRPLSRSGTPAVAFPYAVRASF